MKNKIKSFFAFILFGGLFFPFSYLFSATLEITYPSSPLGTTISGISSVAVYLNYLFEMGIGLGLFIAAVSLFYAGIQYMLSGAKPDLLAKSKDRINGGVTGLLVLLLCYILITTINPSLGFFSTQTLKRFRGAPSAPPSPGVYAYSDNSCTNSLSADPTRPTIFTGGQPDLKDNKNQIKSVSIVQNPPNFYYSAILFSETNYFGKCQFISPSVNCNPVLPYASSVLAFQYSPRATPASTDVTFYRRSFYDSTGGYYKFSRGAIGSGNAWELNDPSRTFKGVPTKEKTCDTWDSFGSCTHRTAPILGKDNIGSIQINGDYLVMLVYFAPGDTENNGPWTMCQAFPSTRDINHTGPKQIKWESINQQNLEPNYLVIIPVANKKSF